MTDRRYREAIKAIDALLAGTGVEYSFTPTSNHTKVRFSYDGRERLVVFSKSTSDHRALKNQLRDVRTAVQQLLGA